MKRGKAMKHWMIKDKWESKDDEKKKNEVEESTQNNGRVRIDLSETVKGNDGIYMCYLNISRCICI